ncbi:MAG: alpha/beta hydrolase [Deltaproteobacteria bacterium]|nr:MAG: alpha/beta hydrolase [Deltaproteobacteria bacterium]
MVATGDISVRDFFVEAAGHRLRVRQLSHSHDESAINHPVLVFLHEGLGCIELWHDIPMILAEKTGLDALIYDRWGHGKSDPLNVRRTIRYVHDEALDSLPDVLKTCGVSDAILIGHSDGGTIALIFAAKYPKIVRGIVTEAAHVFVDQITLDGIRSAVKTYETSNLKQKLTRYHGDNTELLFRGWSDTWLSPEFKEWNIEDCLPRVTCPILVIQGEDDEYGTVEQVRAITTQVAGPSESLLIPGCGHIPHHQARDVVLDGMGRFILSLQ